MRNRTRMTDFSVSVPVRASSIKETVELAEPHVVPLVAPATPAAPAESPKARAVPEDAVKRDSHVKPSLVSLLQSRMEAVASEKDRRAKLNASKPKPVEI